MAKKLITVTATCQVELDESDLPEDVESADEAFDAISEELTLNDFSMDLGDYGEVDFTISQVTLSDVKEDN
jgi:hypothetical protein